MHDQQSCGKASISMNVFQRDTRLRDGNQIVNPNVGEHWNAYGLQFQYKVACVFHIQLIRIRNATVTPSLAPPRRLVRPAVPANIPESHSAYAAVSKTLENASQGPFLVENSVIGV